MKTLTWLHFSLIFTHRQPSNALILRILFETWFHNECENSEFRTLRGPSSAQLQTQKIQDDETCERKMYNEITNDK